MLLFSIVVEILIAIVTSVMYVLVIPCRYLVSDITVPIQTI